MITAIITQNYFDTLYKSFILSILSSIIAHFEIVESLKQLSDWISTVWLGRFNCTYNVDRDIRNYLGCNMLRTKIKLVIRNI